MEYLKESVVQIKMRMIRSTSLRINLFKSSRFYRYAGNI